MKSVRLKRLGIGSDIGLTAVLQFIGALGAFAFQAVIGRGLSKEEAGLYFLAITYMTIAGGIADFGMVAAVFPRLSVARGADTPAFKAGLVVRICAMALAWAAINVYVVSVGAWPLLLPVNIAYASIIVSARMPGVRQYFELLWRLQGRSYVVSTIAAFDLLLGLALVAVLWRLDQLTVIWAVAALTLGSVPGFIVITLPLWRRLRSTFYLSRRIPFAYYKNLTLATIPLSVMVIVGQLYGQLEMLVINSQLSLSDIAAYGFAVKPLVGTMFLSVVVGAGILPVVAQTHAGVRREVKLDEIISVAVRLVGVLGLGICAVCFVFDREIMSIFGPEYVAESYILRIYSITNSLVFCVILLDQCLLGMGRRFQMLIGSVGSFVLAVVLELIAIRMYGIRGMMAAKIISLAALIAYQLYAVGAVARRGVLGGLVRLAIPVGILVAAVLLSDGLALPLHALIVVGSLLASVVAARVFSMEELTKLRTIRAT